MPIFELVRDIYKIDAKTATSRENAPPPPPCGHAFLPIRTIFELNRHIQKTHVLTKFHEDWTKNVTSRVENCPAHAPLNETNVLTNLSFELSRGINGTNVLTKFHEDQTINVASGVFTRQMFTTDDGQRRSQKLTMSTLCSAYYKYTAVIRPDYPKDQ
ncbi:hypothetical protein DPMN_008639 [Dreissena polymorpha]|uniref:Uncharacterized protein n=1 Tax=Dreissena polymorpha TaxID=45954 RepID=A0A9D4RZF2_DREPO|nr:hypothetical protein DPMN_008639 [Dreissena polymorpha]